jgi:hypothetical protein
LEENHSAAMITLARDGTPKVARVGAALIDGRLWSSATRDRLRTRRLRRDPRSVLYVHSAGPAWLTIEATVTILDGPDAPDNNLRLFRVMQGKPTGPLQWFGGALDEGPFLEPMVQEQRLIFQFEVQHVYGLL